jgi:hypothetical protein
MWDTYFNKALLPRVKNGKAGIFIFSKKLGKTQNQIAHLLGKEDY